MRIHLLRRSDRGIALIITLVVIVVLSILAFGFAYSMKVETTLARRASFSSELDWLGRSGVEVAKWVLSQEAQTPQGRIDSLRAKWAGGVGDSNSVVASVDLNNYQIGKGVLSITIKDLDRKFNINVADEMILRQALTLIGVDAGGMGTIVNSILDWRDPDNDPHPSGTETSVYEQQEPPYVCKNGPLDDLSELLLVRGVTPAIYFGSSGGAPPQVFNRPVPGHRSAFEEPTYAVGLSDLFTTLSSGRLNINTASATVLQVMPFIDENVAQAIIRARAGVDGVEGTQDDTPFQSEGELMRVLGGGGTGGAPPPAAAGAGAAAAGQFTRYFTVRSLAFEVRVNVNVGGAKREYVAILRRNGPRDVQTLNMYWN